MDCPDYGVVRRNDRTKAVRVYTVCDESRYLIVRNVPALGCTDELLKLFGLYGHIEEYRMLDEEDCEPYTDVYWIKYAQIGNARFTKRKLDDYKFLGNLLQVTYSPEYETFEDTTEKLEERRHAVLHRIKLNSGGGVHSVPRQQRARQLTQHQDSMQDPLLALLPTSSNVGPGEAVSVMQSQHFSARKQLVPRSLESTILTVREKLDIISSAGDTALHVNEGQRSVQNSGISAPPPVPHQGGGILPAAKRQKQDNRRRI